MSRVLMVSVLALSGAVALSAQAANGQAQAGQSNQNLAEAQVSVPSQPLPASGYTALTGEILQRLTNDPLLSQESITASVGENGVVALDGVVATDGLAQRAVKVVESVPGVSSVKSNILVNQDPFAPPPPALNYDTPINQAPPPPPAAHEAQAMLADALSKVPALVRISGDVYENEVALNGTVMDPHSIQIAEQIAHQVLPSYKVYNYLWVEKHPLSPPMLNPPANFGAPPTGGGR